MPTTPDLDRLTLICETGESFDLWTEATIEDSFLDPCQTMRLRVGVDESRFGVVARLRKGSQFRVDVNDHPVLGGFLDSVAIDSSHNGTFVEVTGRDILSPVVDSHINRKLAVKKGMSLTDMAILVFKTEFGLPVDILDADDAADQARNLAVGAVVKTGGKGPAKRPRKKPKDPLKEIYPKPNEGGWAYFARFAHRVGYHAWAMPDGSGVVLGIPTYEQEASGELVNLRGGAGGGNTIEKASLRSDNTTVPSHVYVYGKSSKPGDKSVPIGYAINESAPFFKPFYITDDESDDKEHADAVARFILGKAMRQACVYQVTVRGLSDAATGRVYTVDTVLNVQDEVCGVEGPMWVEKRTFRKSRQGTFTDLTLIPAESLLMGYYANDSIPFVPKPGAAKAAMPTKPVSQREWTGLDRAVIALWGSTKTNEDATRNGLDRPENIISNDPGHSLSGTKGT